jgi:gamma-glutamylcyclotransferase (GGCT)/AIG2-like uncharacterized protein YtfP
VRIPLVVYGLLRGGEPLHAHLRGAAARGEVRLEGFDLHDLGEYPGAVRGGGTLVGELFDLPNPSVLAALDDAEGVGLVPPLYERVLVDVAGRSAWLYLYARPVEGCPKIASGDWCAR